MENNIQIIQYDGKIAIVDKEKIITNDICFKENKVIFNTSSTLMSPLLAHFPHIDGVADIIVESEVEGLKNELYDIFQETYYSDKVIEEILELFKGYTQAKQNTYTEKQVRKLLNESFEYLTIHTKDEFDEFINKKFQQLTQNQYELVRIDEQGNYVIKEK